MSAQKVLRSLYGLSSGGELGSCGGPPSLPHFEPTNPSPGRPGAPTTPNGSPLKLFRPGFTCGFHEAPVSAGGMVHFASGPRRSITRTRSARARSPSSNS